MRWAIAAACSCALSAAAGPAKPDFDSEEILRAMEDQKRKDQEMKDMLKKAGIDTDKMKFGSDFKNMDFMKNLNRDDNSPPPPRKLGVVDLDTFTLDNIADGTRHVLLKIDKEYPFGEKEDEFRKLSERLAEAKAKDFVLGEVAVQEYGDDRYNEAVAQRFGLTIDDLPAYRLLPKGGKEAVVYTGAIAADDIGRFLSQHTGIRVSLPGTVPALDAIAGKFVAAGKDAAGLRALLKEAKEEAGKVEEGQKASAKFYISVMKKMLARVQGDGMIVGCSDDELVQDCERSRLSRGLNDRRTPKDKKKALRDNLNALESFK